MLKILKSELLVTHGIEHAFMTRQGGVSTGLFSSLNAAMEKQDRLEDVLENRRRIVEHIGGSVDQLVTARQIHSNQVIVVDHPWKHKDRLDGDALVTNKPNIILGVITADCVPILMADKTTGVIAAVHAGWRGAVSGIIDNTIKEMINLGASGSNIVAGIGPCIWQDSYEVDQQFYEDLAGYDSFFRKSENPKHWMFDLPGFVEHKLRDGGVNSITSSPADTYTNEIDFFSNRRRFHRNELHFGCMMSCIVRHK